MNNLVNYEMYELVENVGQERIRSRQVLTRKEEYHDQKMQIKKRVVATDFQEVKKPQLYLPMVVKESLKVLIAVILNEDFELVSMDIRAAFLQAKILDREVYKKSLQDQGVDGYLWKLKKPMYGLDNGRRKFKLS